MCSVTGCAARAERGPGLQVEFIRLSKVTGDPRYGVAAERVIQYLHDHFQEVPNAPFQLYSPLVLFSMFMLIPHLPVVHSTCTCLGRWSRVSRS